MRLVIFCVLILPSVLLGDSTNSYLCIPDVSSGLFYENGKWEATEFAVSHKKWILRRPSEDDQKNDLLVNEKTRWVLVNFTSGNVNAFCNEDFSDLGYLKCYFGTAGSFTMSSTSNRFQIVNDFSFLVPGVESLYGSEPLDITIGKCAAI